MNPRETTEAWEEQILSPHAARSARSRGRVRPEPKDPLRTDFQRDRDRIIHSKAFRRLMHKTQVFLAPEGDHYRTRLTHTLEVAQIARTIARAIRINEDLTEAIVLGHDLGHPPFGHAGEEALNQAMAGHGGFRHDLQSLRMVELLERRRAKDGTYQDGLNLTWEVRNGIGGHSKGASDIGIFPDLETTPPQSGPETVEGQLARVADRIAYVNHDTDDAIRAGLINERDIPAGVRAVLGETRGEWLDTTVRDIVDRSAGVGRIQMTEEVRIALNGLKDYLFAIVYQGSAAKAEVGKSQRLLRDLFDYFIEHPDEISQESRRLLDEGEVTVQRAVCDFLSGMTDRFAIRTQERLFVPRTWESF
ncbi:MAG TPA: deoxyguanosinetriphosphate triphosphohydrolase [bacterium]|nr:deoxyguanosinetriphosphate triphosphohydrolase [bacterium]